MYTYIGIKMYVNEMKTYNLQSCDFNFKNNF